MDTQQTKETATSPSRLGLAVLSHLLNASGDAIVIINEHRRYIHANPAAGEIAETMTVDLSMEETVNAQPALSRPQPPSVAPWLSLIWS